MYAYSILGSSPPPLNSFSFLSKFSPTPLFSLNFNFPLPFYFISSLSPSQHFLSLPTSLIWYPSNPFSASCMCNSLRSFTISWVIVSQSLHSWRKVTLSPSSAINCQRTQLGKISEPPSSVLEFWLCWSCAGLVNAVPASVSSCVHLSYPAMLSHYRSILHLVLTIFCPPTPPPFCEK